jgi:alpha-ketoglutarate-dependent taurine dioxygenase
VIQLVAANIPAEEQLRHQPGLPLVLTTTERADTAALLAHIVSQRASLRQRLSQHGAILFRGCGIDRVEDFEALLSALGIRSQDPNYYYGEVARAVTGSLAMEPTRVHPDMVIAPHNEQAFWYAQPLFIAFYCADTQARFGQTPLVDCAAVAASLSPQLREKLLQAAVVSEYVFDSREDNPELVKGQKRNTWQRAFQASSREAVEAFLGGRSDVTLSWRERNRLHIQVHTGAFARHPTSQALCFRALRAFDFPNLQYMLSELARDQLPLAKRLATQGLAGVGAWLSSSGWVEHRRYAWKTSLPELELTRAEHAEITQCLFEHATIFRWHSGDVLVVDNIRAAHGRLNIDAPRTLHVYMSENVDQAGFIVAPTGCGSESSGSE